MSSAQVLYLSIWLPENNRSDRNRPGDSIGHVTSLNCIPPTRQLFVFLIQIIQHVLYMSKFPFISFPSSCNLWIQNVSLLFDNVINIQISDNLACLAIKVTLLPIYFWV